MMLAYNELFNHGALAVILVAIIICWPRGGNGE